MNKQPAEMLDFHWDTTPNATAPDGQPELCPTQLNDFLSFLESIQALKNPPRHPTHVEKPFEL